MGIWPWRALGRTAVLGWGGYWGWDPVENASLAAAMVDGNRVSSFLPLGDDAGKARYDEGMERVAGVRHVHAVHSGDAC